MLFELLAQLDPSGSLPIQNLDPNSWITEASKHGAPAFLTALFMILSAAIIGFYIWKVRIPESKSQIEKNSRDAESNEKVGQALDKLADTAATAHQAVNSRAMINQASALDAIRYGQALTDCMQHVADSLPGPDGVKLKAPIAVMRDRLDSIQGRMA